MDVESRVPATIDALVALWEGAGLTAWDGPIVSGTYGDAVYVGYDADPEGDQRAAATNQEWAGIGQRKRDEDIDVVCAAVALIGESDNSWKRARDAVYALIETAGQALRSDPSIGQAPPFVAGLIPGDYFQENSPAGYQARVVFIVRVKTRV